MGFRSAATLADLRAALRLAENRAGPAQALATAADKADAPALLALAAERGLPIIAVAVAGRATPTQSPASLAARGTGSVAEAAALEAALGAAALDTAPDTAPGAARPGARLLMPRLVAGAATCAMAESGPLCPPGPLPSPKQSPPSGAAIPDKEEP